MNRFAVVAMLALAGCVSSPGAGGGPSPTPDSPNVLKAKESARGAFEAWRQALIDKNSTLVLSMMSRQLITNWVYTRMADRSDEMFSKMKERLDSGTQIELDYWFRRNKDVQPPDFASGQPTPLPDLIYGNKWIVELWNAYYLEDAEQQKRHALAMEIGDIYPDGDGVTVLVRMSGQPFVMYGFVNENAAWKLDHWVKHPTKERR